jgi:AraC family transcriptional regulator
MSNLTEQTYRQRILAVQRFIQEHLDEDLPLDRLARVAHFSPYHFHRIFRGQVGEGVNEYVRRLRLESAAVALKTTRRGITQVALAAGYGTHEAFTRAFRSQFGVSPSEFRAGRLALTTKEVPTVSADPTQYPVRVESLPSRRVAFLRHVGPYLEVGPTFGRLGAWAGPRGLIRPGVLMLGVCHDDPDVTPAEKLRYDCCLTVDDRFTPEGEVGVQTLEGGDYAILTHVGPYEKLGDAWRWLYGTWLPSSGREPRNTPPCEVYLNTPMDTTPDKLRTEICVPLAAR